MFFSTTEQKVNRRMKADEIISLRAATSLGDEWRPDATFDSKTSHLLTISVERGPAQPATWRRRGPPPVLFDSCDRQVSAGHHPPARPGMVAPSRLDGALLQRSWIGC